MSVDEKNFDLKVRAAERAHDNLQKQAETCLGQIEAFSIAAMRAPALASAGGIAAALAFYSANRQLISKSEIAAQAFANILLWLLIALLITILAPALAYFSQLAYLNQTFHQTKSFEPPFVIPSRKSDMFARTGNFFRWSCVIAVVASIICTACGGYCLTRLITAMS
ncbi:hypothetical protein ACQZ4Y_05600 [Rhizobium sp. L80/93]|uniref:hypothetical protein n=1 Tax=Rhizobium sp. E27B/91 TaxID=2819995 RepID=UPI001ADB58A2|nr:hypothetical protein [Rhizobium sp. E27B/91]MBO9184892.1 hypothetical protein [Rhizobium sp. E27B/91]